MTSAWEKLSETPFWSDLIGGATPTTDEWLRAYALLALRINRRIGETTGGALLDYRGPAEWREQVASEDPLPAARLADDADRLLGDLAFDDRARSACLTAQTRALRAYACQCLGIEPEWLPETVFERAHAQLAAALPPAPAPSYPCRRTRSWAASW
jgi:hypothetical protein